MPSNLPLLKANVEVNIYRKFKIIAKRCGVSVSWLIGALVKCHVEAYEERFGKIEIEEV